MVAIAKKLAESKGGLPFVVFVAMLMGGAVAFVSIAMPTPLFERLVVMSRLPLILPPAEPPLGGTARMMLAVVTGLAAFAATLIGLRLIGGRPKPRYKSAAETPFVEMPFVEKPVAEKPTAAKSVTERLFRERKEETSEDAPRLRRADSHPDAPARRPIFAQEDLGESFDTFGDNLNELHLDAYVMPLGDPIEAEPVVIPALRAEEEPPVKRWDMPEIDPVPAVDPLPVAKQEPPVFTPPPPPPPPVAPPAAVAAPVPEPKRVPPSGNESIEELVERFETGLARRGARPRKVERSSDSVRPFSASGTAPDDMDDALRDALDQLRRMTSRG